MKKGQVSETIGWTGAMIAIIILCVAFLFFTFINVQSMQKVDNFEAVNEHLELSNFLVSFLNSKNPEGIRHSELYFNNKTLFEKDVRLFLRGYFGEYSWVCISSKEGNLDRIGANEDSYPSCRLLGLFQEGSEANNEIDFAKVYIGGTEQLTITIYVDFNAVNIGDVKEAIQNKNYNEADFHVFGDF
jgi:hypothetical protein